MDQHKKYMQLALDLAQKGKGTCAPNPMVGAVVVKDGNIVGTGYHKKAGEPHAEVIAITEAGEQAKGATLYVTLEPCSHHGKTPPCTDLIIQNKLKKVVFPIFDPNELVDGRGKRILEENGIDVDTGILSEAAFQLNESFFIRQILHRPLISLKLATSLDGFITDNNGKSQWITSFEARKYTHKLRAQHRAILVGTKTVLVDNPSLTVRHVTGKDPLRVIIDRTGKIPKEYNVFSDDNYIVFTSSKTHYEKFEYIEKKEPFIENVLEILSDKYEICTLFVEGGSTLITYLLKNNLFDYFYHIIAPFPLGDGRKMFSEPFSLNTHPNLKKIHFKDLGKDFLIKYRKEPFSLKVVNDTCLPV